MELLYVWIEEYKSLKNFGFNFGGEYLFEFDNTNDKGLTYKKNDKYIPNFFGQDISNITGLVGKNGSGKSTVLEYLFTKLSRNSSQNSYKCIIIYRDNHNINIFFGEKYRNSVNLNASNKFLVTNNFPKFLFTIFHSNNIYERLIDFPALGGYNASLKAGLFSNQGLPDKPSIETYFSRYEVTEVKQKINFLNEFKDVLFQNIIPSHIWIFVDKMPQENLIRIQQKDEKDKIEKIIDIFQRINVTELETYKLEIFKQLLLSSFLNFTHLLNELLNEFEKVNSYNEVKEMLINFYKNNVHFINNSFHEKLIRFINKFDEIINEPNELTITHNRLFVRFNLNNNLNRVHDILQIYNDTLYAKNTNFLNFAFGSNEKMYQQSSGEEAFLSLYSRLYDAKKNIEQQKTILLLLDEPDLYLHPQWQKELISNLSQYIPAIFKNCNIQIIITSHSPIIISDLPKNNVVYLEDGKVIEKKGGTFGKNIHDLYKDAFFMENGLLGKFAENKINELIKDIRNLKNKNNKDARDTERENLSIKKRITIIDENIYRFKLEDMYNEAMFLDNENIDAHYEAELAKLKKRFGR